MFKNTKLERIFSAIGVLASAIALTVGSIELYGFVFDKTPTFEQEIALNDFRNEPFYRFLTRNEGRVVFINSMVDMSPALISHIQVLNACNDAYPENFGGREDPEFLDGYVFNRRIVLPINENRTGDGRCFGFVTLEITHDRYVTDLSHGGTGIVTFILRGFFEIESRFYSGPEKRIYLRHLPAGVSDRLRQQ